MKNVTIYADGCCLGNPGPGAWAAMLIYKNHVRTITDGSRMTTNNKMEISAVIEGLTALREPCMVRIYTDSRYIIDGASYWLPRWKNNNYCGARGPIKNRDMWIRLDELISVHRVIFRWIKGHAGDPNQEKVHLLASKRAEELL